MSPSFGFLTAGQSQGSPSFYMKAGVPKRESFQRPRKKLLDILFPRLGSYAVPFPSQSIGQKVSYRVSSDEGYVGLEFIRCMVCRVGVEGKRSGISLKTRYHSSGKIRIIVFRTVEEDNSLKRWELNKTLMDV